MTANSGVVPHSTASLEKWLDYISLIHPHEIELGLDRVRRVAKRLHLLKPATRVITVAGTNGKGSTVKALESVLEAAGYATGSYTSPHILHFNERIRLRGENATDKQIVECFTRIEAGRGDDSLSYFEYTTLAALMLFSESSLDFALLEVGLGGRLDAVNIVDPDLCIITNISLDHEDWLGKGRESIGAEKAGILRRGVPFVLADRDPPKSVIARATELACLSAIIDRDFSSERSGDTWKLSCRTVHGEVVRLADLPIPELNLDNVVAAFQGLQLLEALPSPEVLVAALCELRLAGRFERRTEERSKRRVVLDVAHNAASAELLAASLGREYPSVRVHLVFAAMADKDIEQIVQCLESVVDIWYIAAFEGERAQALEGLEARIRNSSPNARLHCHETVSEAFRDACDDEAGEDAIVVVTGSFHTLAEVYALPNLRSAVSNTLLS